MKPRAFLMGSAAVSPLLFASPPREPDGWYGAIDAGYHYGDDAWLAANDPSSPPKEEAA